MWRLPALYLTPKTLGANIYAEETDKGKIFKIQILRILPKAWPDHSTTKVTIIITHKLRAF